MDACTFGLGAVLYKKNDSKLQVIAYGSRSLSKPERNYSVHKLEFLALKWAISVKFHHYLYGKPFIVFTDHNPLAYVTTTARLDAIGHRWLAELSVYDFSIFHKPGRKNGDADGLSRRPHPEDEQSKCTQNISAEVFREICSLISGNNDFAGLAECMAVSPAVCQIATASTVSDIDWAVEQGKDPAVCRMAEIVIRDIRLTERQRRKEPPEVRKLLAYQSNLFIHENIIYKKSHTTSRESNRLVVPYR